MDLPSVFDLSGRAAVVTGAGSGIGRSTARVLAAAGAGVVCGDIDHPAAAATAEGIVAEGGRAVAHTANVAVHAEVRALVDRAVAEYGRLDVMCNVAGIAADGSIGEASEEFLDRAFAINVKGTVYGCQAALAVMIPQGSGSIINVSSTAIDAPAKNYGVYAMTKAAVAQLTRTLALEVGRHGIRVNVLAPGFTVTAFTSRHLRNDDGTVDRERYDAFVEQMKKISPLRRVGEPEDQAYLTLYLASDASRFATGQIWRANGGQAMPW